MKRLVALAYTAALVSSPGIAQVTTWESSNVAPKSVNPKDANKIVCEVETTTGTRLGERKVCHTAAEWEQIRQGHRENVDKAQQQLTGVPVSG